MEKKGEELLYMGMRTYFAEIVHLLFSLYQILLFIRIVSSWFPNWHRYQIIRFVAFYTDPFLNIFRRILPPLGGILDISPILAFLVIRVLEMIVLSFLQ